uniref:Uncharacterized protein n=1 Tax=Aegilops tauschii subsp. strangulata TaxID=200361 RepID=A0A453FE81_AEGTS
FVWKYCDLHGVRRKTKIWLGAVDVLARSCMSKQQPCLRTRYDHQHGLEPSLQALARLYFRGISCHQLQSAGLPRPTVLAATVSYHKRRLLLLLVVSWWTCCQLSRHPAGHLFSHPSSQLPLPNPLARFPYSDRRTLLGCIQFLFHKSPIGSPGRRTSADDG